MSHIMLMSDWLILGTKNPYYVQVQAPDFFLKNVTWEPKG